MPAPRKSKPRVTPDIQKTTHELIAESKRLREQSAELARKMKELVAMIAESNRRK